MVMYVDHCEIFLSNGHDLLLIKVGQCLDMLDSSDCTVARGGKEREGDVHGEDKGNHQRRKDKENQLVCGYIYICIWCE